MRKEKLIQIIEQNEMIMPQWLFKEERSPIKKNIQKVCTPKTLKQLAREKSKSNDKDLAKMMIILFILFMKI